MWQLSRECAVMSADVVAKSAIGAGTWFADGGRIDARRRRRNRSAISGLVSRAGE